MMVDVGKCYKNNSGEILKIVSLDEFDENVFVDNFGRSYFRNGMYFYNNSKYDLIEEISEKGP